MCGPIEAYCTRHYVKYFDTVVATTATTAVQHSYISFFVFAFNFWYFESAAIVGSCNSADSTIVVVVAAVAIGSPQFENFICRLKVAQIYIYKYEELTINRIYVKYTWKFEFRTPAEGTGPAE